MTSKQEQGDSKEQLKHVSHKCRLAEDGEQECDCFECAQGRETYVIRNHTLQVSKLITSCLDIAHLIVGADEIRIPCHKSLLAFYSDFFQVALYGNFKEAETMEVALPEETVEDVKTFVSWVYTGRLIWEGDKPSDSDNTVGGVRLWVFGDKYMSPKFANAALKSCMERYAYYYLDPASVEFVYENCGDDSELKLFIKDLIRTDGPCGGLAESSDGEKWLKDWKILLAKGGELVQENVIWGFSTNAAWEKKPFHIKNQHKYLQHVEAASVKNWIKKYCRSGVQESISKAHAEKSGPVASSLVVQEQGDEPDKECGNIA